MTQNTLDIPDRILGQLGNREHLALRAFSPRDQKAVKAAAETMRANPDFDAEKVITELGVGEALISFLDEKGTPTIVERATVIAPSSQMGILDPARVNGIINQSLLSGKYSEPVDRESAFEKINAQAQPVQTTAEAPTAASTAPIQESGGLLGSVTEFIFGSTGPRGGHREGVLEKSAKQVAGQVARDAIRGVLGSLIKRR